MPEIFFNGPAGRIEGKYKEHRSDKKSPLALILHPHPAYNGNMNDKVVFTAYKTLAESGFTTLRINFRGVGRSQGIFDNGVGELTDAATALDWLQANNPYSNIQIVVGFSFGAWIALQLIMRRPEITNFIAISPPINKYDFSFLSPCPISGLIIQGDQDSIVPEDTVLGLANKLGQQKYIQVKYNSIQGADHYFRNRLEELATVINNYSEELKEISKADKPELSSPINETHKDGTPSQKVFLD